MAAVDITFGKDDSHAFVLIGRAWSVMEQNIPTLKDWVKRECGLVQTAGLEILAPEHPNGELLADWLDKHGIKCGPTGELFFPNGRLVPGTKPEGGKLRRPNLIVAPGFERLLNSLSQYGRRKGKR